MANAKTLRKRIAAVAVAALGMGVMTAAPAMAATSSLTVTVSASPSDPSLTTKSATGDYTVYTTQSSVALSDLTITIGTATTDGKLTIAAGTGTALAAAAATTYNRSSGTVTASSGTFAAKMTAGSGAGSSNGIANLTASTSGTVYTLWDDANSDADIDAGEEDTEITIVKVSGLSLSLVQPATASRVALATSFKVDYGQTALDPISTWADATAYNATVRAKILSQPTSGGVATTDIEGSIASDAATFTFTGAKVGDYTFLVWFDQDLDADSNSVDANKTVDAGEPTLTVTVKVVDVPASISVNKTATTAPLSTTATYTVSVKDALGNLTELSSGEYVLVQVAAGNGTINGASLTQVYLSDFDNDGKATFTLEGATAGVTSVSVTPGGLIANVTGGTTVFHTAQATSNATRVEVDSLHVTGDAILTGGTTSDTFQASTKTGLSITYKITGTTAGDVVPVTISEATADKLPAGVTAGTSTVTLNSALVAYYTVTATSALSTSDYAITFGGGWTYTVQYDAPELSNALGSISVSPSGTSTAKALVGSSVVFTATAKDQFGDAISGASLSFTTANRNTSATGVGLTDAAGKVAFTLTDTSTSTTAMYSLITVIGRTVGAGGDASAQGKITFVTALPVVNTVTVTEDDADDEQAINTVDSSLATVNFTATVKDANNVVVSGMPVTFTLATGLFSLTKTGYTDASGQVTIAVWAEKTGTLAVTATSGGKSGSAEIDWVNVAKDARKVVLAAAKSSMGADEYNRITATVTDIYGNVVEGAELQFTLSGPGRFADGSILKAGVETDAKGTAVLDIRAGVGETGTTVVTVKITGPAGNQAADKADTVKSTGGTVTSVPGAAAGVGTATVSVSLTGTAATNSEVAKVQAQVAALQTTITAIQTAISTLVSSFTATLTVLQNRIAKIMKKLGIK